MKFKKSLIFISLTPLVLGGCSKESDKEIFVSNYHYLETVLPEEKDRFLDATSKNMNELISLSLNFLVYFHKPDCYWCDQFEPILNKYVSTHETLVVNVPYENIDSFALEFKDYFDFSNTFTFPYLGVMHGKNKAVRIDNEQYMQTENVFVKYMENRVKNTHIYYTDVNYKNVQNNRKITCISMKSTDSDSINLYNKKVYSPMTQSKADILISCHNESGLELMAIDENQTVKEKTQISNSTESSIVERYF